MQGIFRAFRVAVLGLVAFIISMSPSLAALTHVAFEGVVTISDGPSGVSVGDTVAGYFDYDPFVSDRFPQPTVGGYDQFSSPGTRGSITSGSFVRLVPLSAIGVGARPFGDSLIFDARTEDIDGNITQQILIQLLRATSPASNDALPQTPSLADYSYGQFVFQTGGRAESPSDHISFIGDLTSVETVGVSQVPLPPAVWLFLSALSALGFTQFRRARG